MKMFQAEDLVALNPDLTPEVIAKVDEIIAHHRGKPGSLIPALEECQGMVGYLPVELQEYISGGLNVPASAVYGVVTFYSFFSMVPKGKHVIKVCLGTACYVRGTKVVAQRIKQLYGLDVGQVTDDRRFSLEAVRCLGACGLAPVMMVDTDTHGGVTPDRVAEILNHYE